jgi:hypothetical protein
MAEMVVTGPATPKANAAPWPIPLLKSPFTDDIAATALLALSDMI